MFKFNQLIFYFISFVVILTACQKTERTTEHPNLSYSKIKDIDIQFNDDELPDLHHIQRVDSCRLASFNNKHQELLIFDYCDPKKDKKIIKLPQDGPNYLGEMDGAYYLNKDSIFLISDSHLVLRLVDSELNILNSWDLENNYLPQEYIHEHSTSYYSVGVVFLPDIISYPFYYNPLSQSLFLSIFCQSNLPGYQEYEVIYDSPNIVEISLNPEKSRKFYGEWPKSYQKEKIPYNPFVNFTLSKGGQPIINYHYNDYIYDAQRDKFHFAKSKLAKSEFSIFNKNDKNTNNELEVKTYTLDESYVDIHFDPFQNVYYRIFKKAQLDSNIPGQKPIKTEAEWSIIVLDENFDIIGEVLFEKEKYNFLKFIPTQEGILIAENRNNDSTVENILNFDLIKINF